MTTPSARLADLGLALPPVPAPVAAYVPAVRTGNLVFTAGQLPLVGQALPMTGSVGAGAAGAGTAGMVEIAVAAELAATAALNALAAVNSVVPLDQVRRIVRVVVYVASAPGFVGQSAVADGASHRIAAVFGEAGRHARSAIGVAELPLGSPVEVELVVEVATAE